MKRGTPPTKEQLKIIDRTFGISWHGGKARVNILMNPEVAISVIDKAGFERPSSWISRHIEEIIESGGRMDNLEDKMERLSHEVTLLSDQITVLSEKIVLMSHHILG